MANLRLATEEARKPLPMKVKFTARTLDAIRPPATGRKWIYDTEVPGLAYLVTAGGAARFCFCRRVKGRYQRIRLGGAELPVEMARDLARKHAGEVAQGIDPMQVKRLERASTATVGDLLAHFIEHHAKLHKKTWEEDQRQIDCYLKDWLPRRLSTIRKDDIAALHAKIGKHSPYAANRLLSLLHAAYAKAGDLWLDANPAAGITRFKEKSRDRFLQADELPRFLKALDDEPNTTIRDYFKLLLLAGQRKGNTQAMQWSEIDFERATWRIENTKNGQVQIVPLPPPAMAILLDRKTKAASPFVFPGRGVTGHLRIPDAAFQRVLKRAKIKNLRLHDLRRSLASWMTIGGSSLAVVGKALGHLSSKATQIYARLSDDPVRLAMTAATTAMLTTAAPAAKTE